MSIVAWPRGEGILPLSFRVEGVPPSNRGQDARDTQGRDALATGLRDADLTRGLQQRTCTLPPCLSLRAKRGNLSCGGLRLFRRPRRGAPLRIAPRNDILPAPDFTLQTSNFTLQARHLSCGDLYRTMGAMVFRRKWKKSFGEGPGRLVKSSVTENLEAELCQGVELWPSKNDASEVRGLTVDR